MKSLFATPAARLPWILCALMLLAFVAWAQQTQAVRPTLASGGNADSNGRMIAVTGVDITGASILYLVDTESQQLAVYQASGGSGNSQGVRLVGARRIALDLQLDGFNDRSDFSFKKLRKEFEQKGLLKSNGSAGEGAELNSGD